MVVKKCEAWHKLLPAIYYKVIFLIMFKSREYVNIILRNNTCYCIIFTVKY